VLISCKIGEKESIYFKLGKIPEIKKSLNHFWELRYCSWIWNLVFSRNEWSYHL